MGPFIAGIGIMGMFLGAIFGAWGIFFLGLVIFLLCLLLTS